MAYFLQEEPQDSVTIMNNAVRNGAIQEQENLRDVARRMAIEQDPTLSFVNRQIASGLLGAKTAWQDAFNKGDAQGMVNAQKAADSLRQQAASIGWDANGYGADVTLEQAAQNLANNDTRAINNIFYNLQDSGDLYTQGVADYLDKGYSIDSAKRLAGQNADRNTRGNVNQLIDAYHMYGTDPRGAINQNGLRLLGMMAQQGGVSPSELVNFYAQMQASPKDNWNFENSLLTAQNAQNYALDRMDRSQQYNRENQVRSQNFQKEMAQLNNSLGLSREITLMQARIEAGLIQKDAAHNWLKSKYMAAGMDEQTAEVAALTSLVGGKGKGGAGTIGGVKPDSGMFKALMEHANNLISRAEEAEANGNKELAAQLMAEAEQYKQQANKYAAMGGGNDGAGTGGYGDIQNDYDAFSKYYQEALNKANGNREYIDKIITDARQVNPVFADNFIGDYYTNRDSGTPSEQPSTANTPSRREYSSASNARSNPSLNGQMIVGPSGGNVIQKVVDAFNPQLPVYGENDKIDLTKPAKKYMSLDEAKQRGLGITEINGQRVVIE